MTHQEIPAARHASAIVLDHLMTGVRTIERFTTGLAHYVYDVETTDGRRVVVRMGRASEGETFRAGVYWNQALRARGIPLPDLLGDGTTTDCFPFMLLTRLPGTDLAHVYPSLNGSEKRTLAGHMVDIARRVGNLPPARGYGFASTYHAPLHGTWSDVLKASLTRSRARIRTAQAVPPAVVDRVEDCLVAHHSYFDAVAPTPFLDDTTAKNVIVHKCQLSGIVDVDRLCFGDPLFTVGLTNMALQSEGFDSDYIAHWLDVLDATATQRRIVDLYTAIFAVDFMGELGQHFNHDEPIASDPRRIAHLTGVLDSYLARLST